MMLFSLLLLNDIPMLPNLHVLKFNTIILEH